MFDLDSPKTAYIYCRVSSEDQAERETIKNQEEFAIKYCDLHKIQIASWYMDDGISGTIPFDQRPGGKQLIEDIKSGQKPDLILIYNIKRLGRETRVILNAVHEIEQYGIAIRSMTEPFDTSTPTGRFLLTTLAGVASLDRETLLETLWLGANRAARNGKWLGGIVPYGYRVNSEGFLEINEDPLPVIDISEAEVIRRIYSLVAEQSYSTIKVADYLNALGVPPSYVKDGRKVKNGKRKENTAGIWRPGRIRNMIVNPTYKGLHIYGKRTQKKRDLIYREVPAIVSKEIWEKAQKVLRENQIGSVKNKKHDYLLTGLIKCGICGQNYHGYAQNYPNRKQNCKLYYKCNGKIRYRFREENRETCPSKFIPGDWIEELVWKDCVSFIKNPGTAIHELAESLEERKSQKESFEYEKNMLQKTLINKSLEKQSILDLYRRQIITNTDVETQFQKITQEVEFLEKRIKELQIQIEAETGMEQQFNSVEELLRSLQDKIEGEVPFEVKREIVKTLVKEIIVDTQFSDDDPKKRKAVLTLKYRFVQGVPRMDVRADI